MIMREYIIPLYKVMAANREVQIKLVHISICASTFHCKHGRHSYRNPYVPVLSLPKPNYCASRCYSFYSLHWHVYWLHSSRSGHCKRLLYHTVNFLMLNTMLDPINCKIFKFTRVVNPVFKPDCSRRMST